MGESDVTGEQHKYFSHTYQASFRPGLRMGSDERWGSSVPTGCFTLIICVRKRSHSVNQRPSRVGFLYSVPMCAGIAPSTATHRNHSLGANLGSAGGFTFVSQVHGELRDPFQLQTRFMADTLAVL